jgi:hypothetical protein
MCLKHEKDAKNVQICADYIARWQRSRILKGGAMEAEKNTKSEREMSPSLGAEWHRFVIPEIVTDPYRPSDVCEVCLGHPESKSVGQFDTQIIVKKTILSFVAISEGFATF